MVILLSIFERSSNCVFGLTLPLALMARAISYIGCPLLTFDVYSVEIASQTLGARVVNSVPNEYKVLKEWLVV